MDSRLNELYTQLPQMPQRNGVRYPDPDWIVREALTLPRGELAGLITRFLGNPTRTANELIYTTGAYEVAIGVRDALTVQTRLALIERTVV